MLKQMKNKILWGLMALAACLPAARADQTKEMDVKPMNINGVTMLVPTLGVTEEKTVAKPVKEAGIQDLEDLMQESVKYQQSLTNGLDKILAADDSTYSVAPDKNLTDLMALTETKRPVQSAAVIESPAVERPVADPRKRSALSDLNELIAMTDTAPAPTPAPKDKSSDHDDRGFLYGMFSVLTVGFTRLLKKHKRLSEGHELSEYAKMFSARKAATVAPMQTGVVQTPATETTHITEPTGRDDLAGRLHAFRTLATIKQERSKLTRRMAQARRTNDTATMAEITAMRQALNAERRYATTMAGGAKMAAIKERRRVLCKQMTLARKTHDTETMDRITAERAVLKQQNGALNAYIRGFDYKKDRRTYLKPSTLAGIARRRAHEREG